MNLKEYETAKFELATALRAAESILKQKRPEVQGPYQDLFARLAEDRFNLVVIGRFNQGKSSLMNAMLGTERLPTGVVPLTSVITTVSYGSTERAWIEHKGWAMAEEITLDLLPEYVTQKGNPGNQKQVSLARIELPCELLRRGFHFVDTPGLGSAIRENTLTTQQFLPEADALMLVTSYESPLSEEEVRVLRGAALAGRIFIVVNKSDRATAEERQQVLGHITGQIHHILGDTTPRIFSVSAREGIEANRTHDDVRLKNSGVQELREELTRFMLNEKKREFLLRMCARVSEVLQDYPGLERESARVTGLYKTIEGKRQVRPVSAMTASLSEKEMPRFTSCRICECLYHELYDFLCEFQYNISNDSHVQGELTEAGGLCAFHSWQYDMVSSALGTCTGFAPLMRHLATRMRGIAMSSRQQHYAQELAKIRPTERTCVLCQRHAAIERSAVSEIVRLVAGSGAGHFSGLCLDHFRLVVDHISPPERAREFLVDEANALERLSEDMQRYALKRDGLRRALASDEEQQAARRALALLAGHRNVNGPWKRS